MSDPRMPNAQYVKPGQHAFNTPLPLRDELSFQAWLRDNSVPFDQTAPVSDYDMRGFYKALQSGDPRATSAVDPNDSQIHYPDFWKTPYHQTFSNESQWATPNAPHWTNDDKLVDENGNVVFDDRAQRQPAPAEANQ